MTQDRKGAAHDPHDLDVTGFGLGLGDMGEDPSEMFAVPPRQAGHAAAAAAPPARGPGYHDDVDPIEADLPDLPDPGPFGGAGGFDAPAARPSARSSGHDRHAADPGEDPGDWSSIMGSGSAAARAPGFGDDAEPDGDPAAEFSGFETARGVATLGDRGEAALGFRREPAPEHPPKGSYRGDDPGFEDVVGNFGDEEDGPEPPKGSLYREDVADPDEEMEEGDADQSLSLDDEGGSEEDAEAGDEEAGPSIVDRLKRFALPAAAIAAIGGAGYVGWGFVSPMLGSGNDVAPIQMAGPIVPKQPNASLPSFPAAAGAQQRPALPNAAGTLPALPGQQAVTVQPGSQQLPQARQVGLPSAPAQGTVQPPGQGQWQPQGQAQATLLPPATQPAQALPSAASLQASQPYLPAQAPSQPQLPNSTVPGPNVAAVSAPAAEAGREGPRFGGGLNTRTPAATDVEARLASIAADLSAIRSRQDDAARTARSDMDDVRSRIGDLERKVGDGRRTPAAKAAPAEEQEAKPHRAERAERPARSIRRSEARAAYRQEASADDGVPPLKPKVVQGFNLRGVSRGVASVEGRGGVVEVGVGQNIPGVGEVKAIRRYGNDWVVVVGKGVIVQQ